MHRSAAALVLTTLVLTASCQPAAKSNAAQERPTNEAPASSADLASASVAPRPTGPKPWAKAVSRELEVRMGDKKMGEVTLDWKPLPGGGYRMATHTAIAMMAGEVKREIARIETDEVEEFDDDLALRSSSKIKHEGGIEEREELSFTNGEFHAKVDKPSHHQEKTLKPPADWSNAAIQFQAMRTEALGGAKLPLERHYSDFDADDMAFTGRTMRLTGRARVETPGGGVDGWQTVEREDKDGELIRGVADDAGLALSAEFGPLTIVVRGTPGGTSDVAEIDSHVPVEGGFLRGVSTLAVDVIVKGDSPDPPGVFVDSPYQHVSQNGDVYSLVLASRVASKTTAPTLPMQNVPADIERFLGPTADSQSDDPKIVAKAKEIAGAEHDSRRAARAIVQWVYVHLQKRDGTRGTASAVETLSSGGGDCTEHTALTVALARASGIPARNTGGIVLIPGKPAVAGYHAWPELWLGEWVVMDPALGNLDVGPTYIWVGYNEPGEPAEGAKLLRLLGRTTVKIKAP